MSDPKIVPTCPYCGSEHVSCDAIAVWNPETNDWELSSTYDNGSCQVCEQQTKYFTWKEADAPKEPNDESHGDRQNTDAG